MAARRGCMSHNVVRSFSFIFLKKENEKKEQKNILYKEEKKLVNDSGTNALSFFTDELTEPVPHT
jgi:hypothetical protein